MKDPVSKPETETSKRKGGLSRRSFVRRAATIAAVASTVPLEPLLADTKTVDEEFHILPHGALLSYASALDVGTMFLSGRATFAEGAYARFDRLDVELSPAELVLSNAMLSSGYLNVGGNFNQYGNAADFGKIIVGTPGGGGSSKLNGPQGALAFDLEGVDSHCTVIPAAPSVASAQTAAEQVEHYWGALLADVPFTEYATNPLAAQAIADMNSLSFVNSSANNQFPHPVTPQNLFRGQFVPGDGNVLGPYLSQFMIQPTFYGSQFLDQKLQTFLPVGAGGSNYLTSVTEYQLVQNGGNSGRTLAFDPTFRYLRSGRDLAAYTHVDVLYQGYFLAFLVLAGLGAAPNPGNPYIGSKTEKGFGTLGGPDAAATIGEMATRALKASWYHKWIKDLRLRPEEYGALVHARKTNVSPMPQAAAALHSNVLNSAALPIVFSNYGSYLLPQAFPEGTPTHPCYPTGHGTVAGACITALKFFFNGSQKIRPLLLAAGHDVSEPSADGLSLNTYTGTDRDSLDINGELNKLAHNVSIGHGIHAGIHFRSSTYWSILLGEQVGLSILQDRAKSYTEPFTIHITKLDGTTATITNQ